MCRIDDLGVVFTGEPFGERFQCVLVDHITRAVARAQLGFGKFRIKLRETNTVDHPLRDDGRARKLRLRLQHVFLLREGPLAGFAHHRVEYVFLPQPHQQTRTGGVLRRDKKGEGQPDEHDRHQDKQHQPLGAPQLQQQVGHAQLWTRASDTRWRGRAVWRAFQRALCPGLDTSRDDYPIVNGQALARAA